MCWAEKPIHAPPRLSAVCPRLPLKPCHCLVEHRPFPTLEGGMSAASFLHSSLLQAIYAEMLWPVHVQHFCLPQSQYTDTGPTSQAPSLTTAGVLEQVTCRDCLVGLVVKASASRAEDRGFDSRLRRGDIAGWTYTSVLKKKKRKKKDPPVATPFCTRRYRVNTGTGWHGASRL